MIVCVVDICWSILQTGTSSLVEPQTLTSSDLNVLGYCVLRCSLPLLVSAPVGDTCSGQSLVEGPQLFKSDSANDQQYHKKKTHNMDSHNPAKEKRGVTKDSRKSCFYSQRILVCRRKNLDQPRVELGARTPGFSHSGVRKRIGSSGVSGVWLCAKAWLRCILTYHMWWEWGGWGGTELISIAFKVCKRNVQKQWEDMERYIKPPLPLALHDVNSTCAGSRHCVRARFVCYPCCLRWVLGIFLDRWTLIDTSAHECTAESGRHMSCKVSGEIAQWCSTAIPEIGGTIYQEPLVIPIFESKKTPGFQMLPCNICNFDLEESRLASSNLT